MADEEVVTPHAVEVEDDGKSQEINVEFGFIVLKTEEGFRVQPPPEESNIPAPPGPEDIYNALANIQRNMDAQNIAQQVARGMLQASMMAQGRTESGIVVPGAGVK